MRIELNTDLNYTILHLHTDLSNGVTNIDSVTKFEDYIKRAKELNMKNIAFTEHGNIFSWVKKKETCEKNGLKYIHAVEVYITKSLDEKIRDNYHTCLYAKNIDGVKELNALLSKSFDRKDGHFYYAPRITFDELISTSDNILITTACIGGILARGDNEIRDRFIKFIVKNSHRCWLEVQHHQDQAQVNHNQVLLYLARKYNLNLISGTDTHALNATHAKGRAILQKSKGIHFSDEDGWDITLKTYSELVQDYKAQGIFSDEEIFEFIDNTNKLAAQIEAFELDKSYKYPKLYKEPLNVLRRKIFEGIKEKNIDKYPNYESEYIPRIKEELEVYKHNKAIDYLLLDEDIKSYARKEDTYPGPSRGSVSGSVIAYLIGMTEMDSIVHKLNFQRFMNNERISLADVDTDWPPAKRDIIKDYIYNKEGLYCADIITFNTVALKGSIRDVCKALYKKETPKKLEEQAKSDVEGYGTLLDATSKAIKQHLDNTYLNISNYICENVETDEARMRKEYPDVFEYVDIINGTVVSIGVHPCGTVVSPIPLNTEMGLLTVSTSDKPVTMINMKEVENLFFVKLDILGLDNVELINETCKLVGINRLTPDNVPDDEKVWKSMRDNTVGIFQWESDMASKYLKSLFSDETLAKIKAQNPNFKYIDLFSVGNGALRPAGASYRDELAQGIFRDNGHPVLNEFLAPTLGYLVYQEQIIEFLNTFCGFTMGEADTVRRAFAKKTGTEVYIPKIKEGFIQTMKNNHGVEPGTSEVLIVNFLQVIQDASDYLFSLNHSQAYSYIGYICGYLRYYYPLEFFTSMLNINSGNMDKTAKIMEYAKASGINIAPPTYGKSKAAYFFDKDNKVIYKGIESVKFLNAEIADELYLNSKVNRYSGFMDLYLNTSNINSRQWEVLIKIGYFRKYGSIKKLLKIVEICSTYATKKQYKKENVDCDLVRRFAKAETEKMFREVDSLALCSHLISQLSNEEFDLGTLAQFEAEFIGSINITDPAVDRRECIVLEVDTKYTPVLTLYRIQNGEIIKVKVQKDFYFSKKVEKFDCIYVASAEKKNKKRKVEGKWITLDEFDIYINYYRLQK